MLNFDTKDLLDKYLEKKRRDRFLDEVIQANRAFNLYSRRLNRPDLERLVAESLLPLELNWIPGNDGPLLDIGSGWGIPAIPILLARPQLKSTLVER